MLPTDTLDRVPTSLLLLLLNDFVSTDAAALSVMRSSSQFHALYGSQYGAKRIMMYGDLKLQAMNHLNPYPQSVAEVPDSVALALLFKHYPRVRCVMFDGAHCCQYPLPGTVFPTHLRELWFGSKSNHPFDDTLSFPPSLRVLSFGSTIAQPFDKFVLPPALHTLHFGALKNTSLCKLKFPATLHTLSFDALLVQKSLSGLVLPNSLRSLTFYSGFSGSIHDLHLPDGLHTLELHFLAHSQRLNDLRLPTSLRVLRLHGRIVAQTKMSYPRVLLEIV